MQIPMRPVAFPRAGMILVAALLLLIATLVVGVFLAGRPRPLPAPFGPAGAGLLAFDAGGDIVVANADGTGRRPLVATDGQEFGPAWSPDGQRLAFWAVPASEPARVVVVDADGSDPIELGVDARWIPDSRRTPPAWSPDSSRLVVPTSQGHLFLVRSDGSEIRRLGTETTQRFYPAWSPNGQEIAYMSGGAHGGHISVMDVEAGTETQVSSVIGGGPVWSPDGNRLAYFAPIQPGDVFVATRDGPPWTESVVVGGENDDVMPSWSHDGSRLAFVRLSGERGQVLVVPPTGGAPQVIADETAGAAFALICWSPDDRYVTVKAADTATTAPSRYVLVPADGSGSPTSIAATGIGSVDSCAWQRLAR